MNWPELALWASSLTLVVLFIYHIRLRGAIHRLTESLRHPDDPRRVDLSRRLLTPGYIRELAHQIEAELQDRSARIERELLQEQATESMLDQFDDGFVVVDANLKILSANRAATENFAKVNEIVGRTLIEAFLDHRLVEVVKHYFQKKLY